MKLENSVLKEKRSKSLPSLCGHIQPLTTLARRWTTHKPQTSWVVINVITYQKVFRNTRKKYPSVPRLGG